jgi:putative sterol carrier protein
MDASTPKDFFENILPSKFDPSKVGDLDAVVQINITGEKGGNWIITIKNQRMDIAEGTTPSPAIALKMGDNDFLNLVNGKLNAVKAFMTGRLEFKGSMSTGLKLMSIWSQQDEVPK